LSAAAAYLGCGAVSSRIGFMVALLKVTSSRKGSLRRPSGRTATARTAVGDPIHTVSVQRGDSSVGSLPSSV